jgi:hypothetical protein
MQQRLRVTVTSSCLDKDPLKVKHPVREDPANNFIRSVYSEAGFNDNGHYTNIPFSLISI